MIDLADAYIRYTPALRRALACRLPVDEVDDVLADVFLNALERAATYEDRGHPVSSWLYVIMRSRVVDAQRKYGRCPTVSIDDHHAGVDGPEADERMLIRVWVRDCIMRCLDGNQRRVMWLRFVSDLECADVAERLGLSEGAVRALSRRAFAKLRPVVAQGWLP